LVYDIFLYLCGMTYRQYSDHIKLCQYLGKEPQGEFKEFYDFITELWKDMEFSVINDHNKQGIIFHKGTDFYMEQDFKNGWLWCESDRVWSFFRFKKGLEVPETQDFIRGMVEEHLKSKVYTTLSTPSRRSRPHCQWVEEHLKSKVSTPQWVTGLPRGFDGRTS
jgi:hypothetical protein